MRRFLSLVLTVITLAASASQFSDFPLLLYLVSEVLVSTIPEWVYDRSLNIQSIAYDLILNTGIQHVAKFAIKEGASLAIHNDSIFQSQDDGVKVMSLKVFEDNYKTAPSHMIVSGEWKFVTDAYDT